MKCIKCFPQVRWMQSTCAGVNQFFEQASRQDYTLTRLGGVFGQPMAEYVIGQVISHERDWVAMVSHQRGHKWDRKPFLVQRKLTNITMTLLGPGDIGIERA